MKKRRVMGMARLRSACFLFFAVTASVAQAQMTGDIIPRERTLPVNEEVRRQLEDSRWRLGAVRVQPTFGIRDLGYENNVYGTTEDPVSDWRSTVAGGAKLILPVGSKTYLRGSAAPSYTYYKKLADRRVWGGNYDASLLGVFNHMTIDVGGDAFRGIQTVSSEIPRGAIANHRGAHATAEIFVVQRLGLFGSVMGEQQRYSETVEERRLGLSLDALERNERGSRGGVRYRFRPFLDFSLAAEKTSADFLTDRARNNRSNAVLFGLHYDRPRSFVNLSIGKRNGEATEAQSRFARFSTTTGSYYVSHELASRIVMELYGQRGLGYSATIENPYFLETRNGAGINIPLGYRLAVRAFAEAAHSDYPNIVDSVQRSDKTRIYGGGFVGQLYRGVAMVVLASRQSVSSNLAGNNRSIFRLTTALTFGDLFR